MKTSVVDRVLRGGCAIATVVGAVAAAGYAAAQAGPGDPMAQRLRDPILLKGAAPNLVQEENTVVWDLGDGRRTVFHNARIESTPEGNLRVLAESRTTEPDGVTSSLSAPVTIPQETVTPYAVWWDLLSREGVPVSYEWAAVDAGRAGKPEPNIRAFSAEPGETVRSVLKRLTDEAGGGVEVRDVSGVPWLASAPDAVPTESLLDVPITLSVSGVSSWDAVKAVVRSVNATPGLARPLALSAQFYQAFTRPPAALTEERTVSLAVVDTPAREALGAIAAQGPVALAFHYYNYHPPQPQDGPIGPGRLTLYAFARGETPAKRGDLAPEEAEWWRAELAEANANP
ncbi:MAG: hypothetical protein JXR94_16255 [Candidatus Hydrogenedentes bacterium]|nr:hypothetical protein [Candidatus Hydrogenedentota bacterium]